MLVWQNIRLFPDTTVSCLFCACRLAMSYPYTNRSSHPETTHSFTLNAPVSMTLSDLFLLTTNVKHNAQKNITQPTDNGFFFLQAVYGQINTKKRLILWNICKPCPKCQSPHPHSLMYGSLPPVGKSNPSFIWFCSPLKPLYFFLYYVSYTPNVYKLSYVSGFFKYCCRCFLHKTLKRMLFWS